MKTSRAALLDVNVLIALLDREHVFHNSAHAWFNRNRHSGWATCPITENGCVRILSKAGLTTAVIRQVLTELCSAKDHLFWPDSVSILNPNLVDVTSAGPRNLTDIYLLSLAVRNHGRLITFDQSIPLHCVKGCSEKDVEVLS